MTGNAAAKSVTKSCLLDLTDLATRIQAEHQAATDAMRRGIEHAIAAGELLLQAKAQLSHGQWGKWLRANVQVSWRTARACMQLAELDPEKRQRVADLPMRE